MKQRLLRSPAIKKEFIALFGSKKRLSTRYTVHLSGTDDDALLVKVIWDRPFGPPDTAAAWRFYHSSDLIEVAGDLREYFDSLAA